VNSGFPALNGGRVPPRIFLIPKHLPHRGNIAACGICMVSAHHRTHTQTNEKPQRMPTKNQDLHGFVPDSCPLALVLVDVINDMEFEGGERLLETAFPAAERIAALKARAREAGVPVIYCNDNFGRWRSDFHDVVEHVMDDGVRGEQVARLLKPDRDDYFVLKPKHSAFFATTLDTLLSYLGARRLIFCGFSGDVCVLFSAGDAHMRDFHIHVPSDCIASIFPEENKRVLAYMRRVLSVNTTRSDRLDLAELIRMELDGIADEGGEADDEGEEDEGAEDGEGKDGGEKEDGEKDREGG
jgi:nicotinamidase-related amidase